MTFEAGLFTQPNLDGVTGFDGGRFDPFQKAHILSDTKLGKQLVPLFRLLNVDAQGTSLEPDTAPNQSHTIWAEDHDLLTTPRNGYVSFWNPQFLNDFHNSVLQVTKLRTEKI